MRPMVEGRPPDAHSIRGYFSRSALRYHEYATLQRQIAARLADRFLDTLQPVSILELGCGTGFLTRKLSDRFPRATIDAIDLSPEMIRLARETLPALPVRWQVADMNRWRGPGPYELVASSTALHWADSLGRLARRIGQQLVEGGQLVAAVMAAGTLAELHQLREEIAPGKGPVRPLPSEGQLRSALAESGLKICQWEPVDCRRTFPSSKILLRALQRSAFTGGPFASPPDRKLVRSELERLGRIYQQRFGDSQGNVHATFRIIYLRARAVHSWRPC